MGVRIKICGNTSYEDAKAAMDMGADMLGFIFYPKSPRYIEPQKALDIVARLPSIVDTVGVFVNPDIGELRTVTEEGLFNWVQLHGDETPEFCDSVNWSCLRTMKALRVKDADDIKRGAEYRTDALLYDAYNPKLYGGTGETFDWSLLDSYYRRVFLAGGINPDNAVQAIETGVYGIDVCSGVESKPGKKDLKKLEQFFNAIHLVRG